MAFGNRLKEIRLDLGLSQKEMAKKYNIGLSSLKRYEKNISLPGGFFLINIDLLGYNLHWLMTGDGDKSRHNTVATDPFLRDIWNWLEDLSREQEGYRSWFEIQFEKSFPDFKEWKERKKGKESGNNGLPQINV